MIFSGFLPFFEPCGCPQFSLKGRSLQAGGAFLQGPFLPCCFFERHFQTTLGVRAQAFEYISTLQTAGLSSIRTSKLWVSKYALPFFWWVTTPANVGGASAGSSPIDFEI